MSRMNQAINNMVFYFQVAVFGMCLIPMFTGLIFMAIRATIHLRFVAAHRNSKTTSLKYLNKYSIHDEYRLAPFRQPMYKSRYELSWQRPMMLYCFCLEFTEPISAGPRRDYTIFLPEYVQWCLDNTKYQYEFALSEAIGYKFSRKPNRRIWFMFLNQEAALKFKLTFQDEIVDETSTMYSSKNNNYEPE